MKIGVISDTHGLLRPEALAALHNVDHILHAGDVGDAEILDQLRQIAPVTAIRGNIDRHGTCALLPEIELLELSGCSIYMLHDANALDLDPVAAGIQVVVSGHSHQPRIEWRKNVLYFNPGSAGPRRFSLPVTIAHLELTAGKAHARLIEIL